MVTLQNARLVHRDGTGTKTAEYVVYGLVDVEDNLQQTATQISLPFGDFKDAMLSSFFGQKMSINCSFVILERNDDYTAGTGGGSYPDGSTPHDAFEQKKFLLNEIMKSGGRHEFEDETGEKLQGRFENMRIRRVGDDPVAMDASFVFKIGNPIGTLNPFA